ncbi:hypothetical protein [Reichenbachiella ulvae]|uniref:Uncharacterized protein n=1 Tax=Reichenbachiella ulvae TaxID=2980104 RepID=A0ABT3CXL7_9BACT|nr:hypothetical protein [Reichenbachiella ulvae]MCV9388382.1 hypothetical protein [Reichenbachiella ulvae]
MPYIYGMQVERSDKEIVVRITENLDSKRLQGILDLIRYGELTAKSEATQAEADELASSINKSWWAKNKSRFTQ